MKLVCVSVFACGVSACGSGVWVGGECGTGCSGVCNAMLVWCAVNVSE